MNDEKDIEQFMQDLREIGLRQKVKLAAKANRRLLFLRRLAAILAAIVFLGVFAFILSKWFFVKNEALEDTPPTLDKRKENQGIEEQTLPVDPNNQAREKQATRPIAQGPGPGERPLFRSVEGVDGSVDSTMLPVFQSAFEHYTIVLEHEGRFSRAIHLLEQEKWSETRAILTPLSQNDTAKYLLAVLALRTYQAEKALPYLTALYRDDSPYKAESEWLLGLTMVLQGKEEQARQILGGIAAKQQHPHKTSAAQLLKVPFN